MKTAAFSERGEFDQYVGALQPVLDFRYAHESRLARRGESFTLKGVCAICQSAVDFQVRSEGEGPNWRETLTCRCGLNNRERAMLHFMNSLGHARTDSKILALGEPSGLLRWMERFWPDLAQTSPSPGQPFQAGFSDRAFDTVVVAEVLSHLDAPHVFGELARVLKPGGRLFFTVPFHYFSTDSELEPWSGNRFGWDILGLAKTAGFHTAEAHTFWSEEFGYLGPFNFIFVAEKR